MKKILTSVRCVINAKPTVTVPILLCILLVQAWHWWYPAGHVSVTTVIPVTIVQLRGHEYYRCLSIKHGIRTVQKASEYWEQYGIKFKVVNFGIIKDCEWATISSDKHGDGELSLIIDEIEQATRTFVVVLPEKFTNLDGSWAPEIAGLASTNRNGFALVDSDWRVTAHEFGHALCGCYHTYVQPGNLLESGILDRRPAKEDIVLTVWQAFWARKFARDLETRYTNGTFTEEKRPPYNFGTYRRKNFITGPMVHGGT